MHPKRTDPAVSAFRRLFCWSFCGCELEAPRPVITLKFKGFSISFTGNPEGDFMSNTTVDGGPFNLSVDKFVDDKGNTTTDTDIPVWAIDDTTLATLAPDPANPQGNILTLTGKAGAINITASFGDQTKLNTPGNYQLQGSLGVAAGLAVAGAVEIAGPGVTP